MYATINNQPNLPILLSSLMVLFHSIIHSFFLSFVRFWPFSYFCSVSLVCLLAWSFQFNRAARYYLHSNPLFKIEFHTLWIKFIQEICWFEWNDDSINKFSFYNRKWYVIFYTHFGSEKRITHAVDWVDIGKRNKDCPSDDWFSTR